MTEIHTDSWDLCCWNHSQQGEPVGLLSGFCRAAQSFFSETFQRFLEGIARDLPVLVVFLQPGSRPARHAMFETGIPKGLHPASAAKLDHCRLRVLALAMTFVEGNRDRPGGSFRDPDQRHCFSS